MKRNPLKTLHNKALKLWKIAVKMRDENKCVVCGDTRMLNAHHIQSSRMWPELRYDIDNGVSVCPKHHKWGKNSFHQDATMYNKYIHPNQRMREEDLISRWNGKEFTANEPWLKASIRLLEKYIEAMEGSK